MRHDPRRREAGAYPFQLRMDVRYGDLDTNRHLNNVAFARFFEEGRVRFHYDIRDRVPDADPLRPIIANVTIDYLAEGSWPDAVTVAAGIAHIGTSSYTVGLALFQKDRCIALCNSVVVNRAGEGEGGAPLGATLRGALEAMRLSG